MSSGVVARVHGNTGKRKKLGLSFKEIEDVVQLILNYAGACEREREREREGGRGRGREREREGGREGGREREREKERERERGV